MPRIKRSVASRARRKKILKAAKGYYGARSRTFKVAKQAVLDALALHRVHPRAFSNGGPVDPLRLEVKNCKTKI